MSSVTIERPSHGDPGVALEQAAQALAQIGYEVVSRSAAEYHLFYKAGSVLAARLDGHRHRLTIRFDGKQLVFLFEAGVNQSGLLIQSERDELERRVALATRAAGVPAPGAARRCTTCGTLSEAGATVCAVCGAAL
jgi:hypothetical protein